MQAITNFQPQLMKLTDKQREVVRLLIDCHSTKEIARILNISPSGVEQRLKGVRHRCGNVSRRELQRHFRSTDAEALEILFQPSAQQIEKSLNSDISEIDKNRSSVDASSATMCQFLKGVIYGFALGLFTAAGAAATTYYSLKLFV